MTIAMNGLPRRVPERRGAVRMEEVAGEWRLEDAGDAIRVGLKLYVNPGDVPRRFANRRLAGAVGQMLANLRNRFPCSP